MEKSNSKKICTVEQIKDKIEALFAASPTIHINLNKSRKKLKDLEVTIKSLHKHFFIVEHTDGAYTARYTIQFSELLTRDIDVIELMEDNG